MTLLESIDLFPMILTLLAFQIGRMAQEKWKKPIFNPTLIGMSLSELFGGMAGVTTAVIIVTGIGGNMLGPVLCKLFKIEDPVAQGVAFGTAAHVIGTAKANELSQLTGAASSLSLVVAGLLTAVLMPILTHIM